MTLQSLSKLAKKLKITAGALQILFGVFGISLGIYLVNDHAKAIVTCIWLWLVSLCCAGRGIKLIYDSRREN